MSSRHCHILFKSGIFTELAENCPTTQWYTHVLAIFQWEHLQIFWNLEYIYYIYYVDLIHIYYGKKMFC